MTRSSCSSTRPASRGRSARTRRRSGSARTAGRHRPGPACPRARGPAGRGSPRARWRALLTDWTLVPSSSATPCGLPPQHLAQDQHRPLSGREDLQSSDEGEADIRRRTASSAGSSVAGSTSTSGAGSIHVVSESGADNGVEAVAAGPRSTGRARRLRLFSMSRHTLVAMRYSHDRTGRTAFEAVGGAPGPQQRVLDGILGFGHGTEHPVAVPGAARIGAGPSAASTSARRLPSTGAPRTSDHLRHRHPFHRSASTPRCAARGHGSPRDSRDSPTRSRSSDTFSTARPNS